MIQAARPITRSILVLLTLATAAGVGMPARAACEDVDPLGLLPIDEACPGWVRDGEAQTAYTIEELTDIIDGGAYLYEQYGFVAAAFQNYAGEIAGEPVSMTLSVFNQGTAENAEALYNDPGSGSGDPVGDWEGLGEARMRIAFGIVSFQFWESCFFVSIVVPAGGEDAVPHARCIAEEVLGLIGGATPVRTSSWGRVKGSYQ